LPGCNCESCQKKENYFLALNIEIRFTICMPTKYEVENLIQWIEGQPGLMEKLNQLKVMREKGLEVGLNSLESEIARLLKQIGAEQLQACLQAADPEIAARQLEKGQTRVHGKKKLNFRCMFGEVEVQETVLRRGTQTLRPLCLEIGVKPRGLTLRLQRLAVDFAAESSFDKAAQRLDLHHGITVSPSTLREITLKHGENIARAQTPEKGVSILPPKGVECLITSTDGTMLPTVKTDLGKPGGGRKNRQCQWKENRLVVAQVKGEVSARYGLSTDGVEEAGHVWADVLLKSGWGILSYLHVVADGAAWIERQCRIALGTHFRFLLDFYHVSEYVAAAGKSLGCSADWLEKQKERLKENLSEEVIRELRTSEEPAGVEDEHAPVRVARRYLENHRDQLDYKGARENDLPIGSGLIEGGHRHVLQKRLKISGAWWREDNLRSMAHLRVLRANNEEANYWKDQGLAA